MSQSHRLAWAAGFIDGDGFITIQQSNTKINGKYYRGFYLRVGACQASLPVLEELQTLFGGSIRSKNSGPNREGYNRKPQWVWTLSTNAAKEALEQLLPYLIHKKASALVALEFQSTMTDSTRKVTDEIKTYRKLLLDKIQEINALD